MGANDGIASGSPTFAAGKFGNAVSTSNGYYTIPGDLSSTVGTIEMWLKHGTSSASEAAIGNSNNSSQMWVGIQNGAVAAGLAGGSGTLSGGSIFDGAFHHVAVTFDGTNARLWVDGTQVAILASTAGIVFPNNQTGERTTIGKFGSFGFAWGGSIDEIRISSSVRYANTFTPATSPFSSDANTLALYHLDTDGSDSTVPAGTTTTIPVTDPGLIFSPYNWNVAGGVATTINPGAYCRFTFSGATGVTLNFDMSNVSNPPPRVKIKIDDGPMVSYELATAITPSMPATNSWNVHTVDLHVQSTSQSANRWNTPQNSVVKLTSITLNTTSGSVRTRYSLNRNVLIYGDSITEGYLTLQNVTTPDGSDSSVAWSYLQRNLLGVEVGVVGFGGQGWTTTGQGGVPTFPNAYNLLYSGVSRSFTSPVPDLIVINMGQNDGGDVTSVATSMLNTLLAINSTTKIALMRPFSGTHASELQAAAAACSAPSRVTYVDTTGWWSSADSYDGVHPWGVSSQQSLGPRLANAVRSILAGYTPKRFINVGGTAKPIG